MVVSLTCYAGDEIESSIDVEYDACNVTEKEEAESKLQWWMSQMYDLDDFSDNKNLDFDTDIDEKINRLVGAVVAMMEAAEAMKDDGK